jgi:hypothetical protein
MRKLTFPALIALTLALTACSSVGAGTDVKLSLADPVAVPHPARPAPVEIHDLKWRACGSDACTSVAAAKQSIKDRLAIAEWMGEANNLIDYYERVTAALAKSDGKSDGKSEPDAPAK